MRKYYKGINFRRSFYFHAFCGLFVANLQKIDFDCLKTLHYSISVKIKKKIISSLMVINLYNIALNYTVTFPTIEHNLDLLTHH